MAHDGGRDAFLRGGYGPDDKCVPPYCLDDVGAWSLNPFYRHNAMRSGHKTADSLECWRWEIPGEDDYTFFVDGWVCPHFS